MLSLSTKILTRQRVFHLKLIAAQITSTDNVCPGVQTQVPGLPDSRKGPLGDKQPLPLQPDRLPTNPGVFYPCRLPWAFGISNTVTPHAAGYLLGSVLTRRNPDFGLIDFTAWEVWTFPGIFAISGALRISSLLQPLLHQPRRRAQHLSSSPKESSFTEKH